MPINYVATQASNVTNSTVLYNPTTTGVQSILSGILIANKGASQATVLVTMTNAASTVTTTLVPNIPIPPNNALDVLQAAKIHVPYNYVVTISASSAVDATLSSIEVS